MADLKPCPFCGSTDVGARKRGPVWRQWVRVNCFYCSTVGPPGTYLEQAVRLWNRRAVVAAHDRGDSVQAPKPLVYCARKRSDMTPCVITDGDCARDDSGECVGCGRKNVIAGVSDPDDYPAATLDPPTRLVPVDPTIPPEYGQQYRLCQVEDCESDEETGESRATVCGKCYEEVAPAREPGPLWVCPRCEHQHDSAQSCQLAGHDPKFARCRLCGVFSSAQVCNACVERDFRLPVHPETIQAGGDPEPLKVGDLVESDFIEGRVHDASPRIAVIPEPNFSDGLHYPRLADLRRVEKEKP